MEKEYEKRDIDDTTIPVTITLDKNLKKNLELLRDRNGFRSLSKRINDLLWKWFNEVKEEKRADTPKES